MRRIGIVCLLLLLLTGCGGVPKEDYVAVVRERDALRAELQEAQAELQGLRDEPDTVTVKVRGSFTATVRALIPDYETDYETPRVAVVTLFQSTPFTIYTMDLTQWLEVGKTYVFEVEMSRYDIITREEYESGTVLEPEVVFSMYPSLYISNFHPAEEKDCGLDSVHLEYEACKPDVRKGWVTADE